MDFNGFKYTYNGSDNFIKYFADHDCPNWSFNKFCNYFNLKTSLSINEKKLKSAYKNSLKSILNDIKIPKNIKKYANELVQTVNEEINHSLPSSIINFNMGSGSFIGDGNVVVHSLSPSTTASDEHEDAENKYSKSHEDEVVNIDDDIYDDEYNLDSFTSDDYHPNRTNEYIIDSISPWVDSDIKWMIDDVDISNQLKEIKKATIAISSNNNLSDNRILILNSIYVFSNDINNSVTKYMGKDIHKKVQHSLENLMKDGKDSIPNEIPLWVFQLSQLNNKSFIDAKKECTKILNESISSDDGLSFLAASILFNLVPKLVHIPDEAKNAEDTFVHLFITDMIEHIFMTNDLLHQEWANGYISSSTNKKSFKPDWVCYIKPWINRYDLVICEVKAPGKKNYGIYSDFTKLGFEMKTLINNLVSSGVNSPKSFGILVEGYVLRTFIMDIKCPSVYRMVELNRIRIPDSLSSLSLFTNFFGTILQLKVNG
ncbi:unnamed protein product [Cunninghamella echinulata]